MKRIISFASIVLTTLIAASFITACGKSDNGSTSNNSNTSAQTSTVISAASEAEKDILAGSWKQTDEINGDWEWTFDGSGSCSLKGITTGFEGKGTYTLDKTAKTVTVNIEQWSDQKVYEYTLDDTKLDLKEKYSSYHLIKQ